MITAPINTTPDPSYDPKLADADRCGARQRPDRKRNQGYTCTRAAHDASLCEPPCAVTTSRSSPR